ncbi:acyl-CoA N-acyltransferase [Xylariales sp. AK1849]|nr:acyl-CoA N-acyltransferase [Xylariales sp. AK1849]
MSEMAPQKRKRSQEEGSAAEPPTRRTTRHTVAEPEKQLRSGRIRANTLENPDNVTELAHRAAPESRSDASKTKAKRAAVTPPPPAPTKTTRRTRDLNTAPETHGEEEVIVNKENTRPPPTRTRQATVPAPKSPTSPVALNSRPKEQVLASGTTALPKTRVPRPKAPPQCHPQAPAANLTDPASASAITPKRHASSSRASKPPPTPRSDRNIDKVVLGNICFRAWYPSYYGKEVLGDSSGNAGGKDNGAGTTKIGGGKKEKEVMLDRLYVCPCCFKYSKELVAWSEHVRYCEQKTQMPGTKVYTHPKGKRTARGEASTLAAPADAAKRKGKIMVNPVDASEEATVDEEGEWSVWEVDGEDDVLFCQNLSLFAKLFLDNKSVFFDVTGFNYFLLAYKPPAGPTGEAPPPRPQIVGFFSKEKMSWDNNNLACILVFPPWQRKSLGGLLMGVSYEISRREGVLGGPEKPISELGRKGYKRFWAGEIARWLLSLEPVESSGVRGNDKKQISIDVNECSKATWIVPEDCLVVLREMGVIEETEAGLSKELMNSGEEEGVTEVIDVPRVRIDKEAVRRWVEGKRIGLERACDPDGFIMGYAIRTVLVDEEY